MGPQLFLGWYQMILDVTRSSELFSDVFSWVITLWVTRHFSQDALNWSKISYRDSLMYPRCAQIFANVFRWSQMFLDFLEIFYTCPLVVVFFLDVLLMFSGCLQDFFRMLWWVLWAWWNLIIISNESMDFNDPKELNDPQLFDDTQLFDDWKYGLL